MVLGRQGELAEVERRLKHTPAVAILGARQVGKTTLARAIVDRFDGPSMWFDLEDRADRARLAEPELALEGLEGLVVLDEIQLVPDLFSVLRVIIDRQPERRFLVLGSASPDLLMQSSQTLAGRVGFFTLRPLGLRDLGKSAWAETRWRDLWLRGGFPRALLAADDRGSVEWRQDFISTFVARDLPALGAMAPSPVHERFFAMVANLHGQTWNAERVAGSIGLAGREARRYLDLLSGALVVRQIRPWHANISKRQVRRPKVYVADTGLLHALLNIDDRTQLERHPVLGASWEWFVMSEIQAALDARDEQLYFWGTHGGAELDLLFDSGTERIGFEIKRTVAPKVTPSIRSANEAIDLAHTYVVHGGDKTYPISNGITALALADIHPTLGS